MKLKKQNESFEENFSYTQTSSVKWKYSSIFCHLYEKVIEIEGKEGKYYIELDTFIDKYVRRPKELEKLSYVQFVKRYEKCTNIPSIYDYSNDLVCRNKQRS